MPDRNVPKQSINHSPRYRTIQRKPKKSHLGRWIGIGIAMAGVSVLSATAGALLAVSLSNTPFMQSTLSAEDKAVFSDGEDMARGDLRLPELTRPVNILVLGTKVLTSEVDTPTSQNQGYHALVNSFEGLSDTMLLLRFDPKTKQMIVLSIPRDTRTYVEGAGVTKINAANYYGGPALSAKTVSELLGGVGIDRYIRVNVQGVEKLIDALGGVTVNVPKDMKYQDDSQHLYINLKAGEQHLTGEQALQFLRFRYDENGDIGRVQRQQMLMGALVEQALSPKTLVRMPKILSIIQSHIDTNMSLEEMVALAGFGSRVNRSDVEMLLLPGRFGSRGGSEYSYWIPSRDRARKLSAQYFDLDMASRADRDRSSTYLKVAIQDSTGEPGISRKAVNALNQAGYRNVFIDKPQPAAINHTRIIAQQGDRLSAEQLQQALGIGEVRVESTGNLGSDITIQLGRDWAQRKPQALHSESSL